MTKPFARTFSTLFIVALFGCEWIEDLRGVFHGGAKPPGPEGSSTLIVEVDPSKRIEIRLDDTLVARRSPYRVDALAAGEHQLVVRAEGYHPFATPVVLGENDSVTLTLSLRQRPTATAAED